ncbi:MAG: small subunit ribosomal protein [Actinomycetota bacterium]|jgi:small subunit ribosomal protein S16|nr:small subunit ribosomal protein [Actinomycetota bacterium]
MVKIRLMRVGKRKQPSYRVVVADSRSPRDGRIIEAIGHYHPREDPSVVEIDNERALYWLKNGAQASDSVRQLLRITGAWSEFSGEAPLGAPPAPKVRKATPAASVTQAEDTMAEADPAEVAEVPDEVATSAEEDPVANAETPATDEEETSS